MFENIKLLIDGKNAFKEILDCIDDANELIYINMFIWRDDNIGNEIASHLLDAVKKGVKVFVSADRYGSILEHAEETRTSFFHKELNFSEKFQVGFLRLFYGFKESPKFLGDKKSQVYKELIENPNFSLENNVIKKDHSKYYIFDDKIVIFGGINVEDKENGKDLRGMIYQDYMVKIIGEKDVSYFKTALVESCTPLDYKIVVNNKSKKLFQIEDEFLKMIDESKTDLLIYMAYFSPLKSFMKAIKSASERGVKIKIMISKSANLQDNLNKSTAKKLSKLKNVLIYYTDKMCHTKLMQNENYTTFGSCNINKKAFNCLDELNIILKRDDSKLNLKLQESLQNELDSAKVMKTDEIKYNHFVAFLESIIA